MQHFRWINLLFFTMLFPSTVQLPSTLCSTVTIWRTCSWSGDSSDSQRAGVSSLLWSARLLGSNGHRLGLNQRFGPARHRCLFLLLSIFRGHWIWLAGPSVTLDPTLLLPTPLPEEETVNTSSVSLLHKNKTFIISVLCKKKLIWFNEDAWKRLKTVSNLHPFGIYFYLG